MGLSELMRMSIIFVTFCLNLKKKKKNLNFKKKKSAWYMEETQLLTIICIDWDCQADTGGSRPPFFTERDNYNNNTP